MRKIIILLVFLGSTNMIWGQTVAGVRDTATTVIVYEKAFYDFGTAIQGALVTHSFKFTNTGNVPLVITEAKATCGCTLPTYPKEPIAPGAVGEIAVTFNTADKVGRQLKVITIVANTTPGETFVQISGAVKVPKRRKH